MRVLLAIGLAVKLVAAAVPPAPVVRDAALWPFSTTSPWNVAIGDQATYAQIVSPRFSSDKGGSLNCGGFSHPVYMATASDPLVAVSRRGTQGVFASIRVPQAAQPDAKSDGHLHIIDEMRRSVVEMFGARRESDGSITAAAVVRNDLTDDGVYPSWHGVRAYGGSAIAGLIRVGELNTGIRHALAIAVEQQALNRNAPGGRAWVWPASSCDSNNAYGTSGNLHMGTLLAIPATVDLATSGLRGPALEIATALQDYGAYITDCTGSNLSFYAEPAAQSEAAQVGRGDVFKLVSLLQVVSNNAPQMIAGGGKRRRPSAPPFAPPGQLIKDGGIPPQIQSEPQAVTVDAGSPIRLAVAANGSEPLVYRWRRGGASVGANAAELQIASSRPVDAGNYTCTVTNAYGRVVTSTVVVTVRGGVAVPRRPGPSVIDPWRRLLQDALRQDLAARRVPQYRSELMRGQVSIRDVDDEGSLTIAAGGAGLSIAWSQLKDVEVASLAADLARGDDQHRHAVAAFFLHLAGDADAARAHLDRAGSEADAVRGIFP